MEFWLRPNYRAVLLAMVLPVCFLVVGFVVVRGAGTTNVFVRTSGAFLAGAGFLVMVTHLWNARLPRLAYQDRHLLVFLRNGLPIRIPIQHVECFFLGRAASTLKDHSGADIEAQTVVVRLAQSASQWEQGDVKPALGSWCDSYITIRGTWCEPLTIQRVNQLNRRLAEVHRDLRIKAENE